MRALIFDVDGTLYRQSPLRRAMLFRILGVLAANPAHGWQTIRVLRAYRQAQEDLRFSGISGAVASEQIRLAGERTNVDREFVIQCVSRWMEQEPLAFLPRCVQPGVLELLRECRARGVALGALSDYPAEPKLRALGLHRFFDVVLCADSPDVNAFKPNPRGLLLTLERLGVTPAEALYVGDRADVDAPTAHAAGVRCAILNRARPRPDGGYINIASYLELQHLVRSGWQQ